MKANELLKKLGKLLGKKQNTSAGGAATVIQLAPQKTPEVAFPVHDGLGVIQLHANWRN